MIYDCIIIGAGASGLMCAATMELPVKGLILEKTKQAGTKLLMSGSGQCNITHAGSIKDFIPYYGENGGKVRNCLYKHNNLELINFLKNNGVKTITREDDKVFPETMNARDVLHMLLKNTKQNGFEIKYNSPVTHISQADSAWCVKSDRKSYMAKNIVIAAGGCSYPTTGSDGSIFKVLSDDLNVKITQLKPALSSIQISNYPYCDLSGISFENAGISIWHNDSKIIQNEDALLFTHKDLSGPGILNISKYASAGDTIKINYLYPLNYEQVLERLKEAAQNSKLDMFKILADEFNLPKRFCQLMTSRYGNGLKNLAKELTNEAFSISSVSGFKKAMATSGGIDISQIKTSTLEFKSLPGIFAIGEVLDIDGATGGYNLQFAFSSAKAAGTAILANLA